MIVLGLTGSIGMGKSTICAMFEREGIPCHDSDAAVHELLSPEGAGYFAVTAAFPYYSYPQIYKRLVKGEPKIIERKALGAVVFHDVEARKKLEGILHPLVRASQKEFVRVAQRKGLRAVILDIPLLFETGAEDYLDHVICVHAPYHIQKQRVLARPGMTEERFAAIVAAQMPSEEKCARSDFVIETGLGRAVSMRQVKDIVREVVAGK